MSIHQVNPNQAKAFLHQLLVHQLDASEVAWVEEKKALLEANYSIRSFYMAFSAVSRFVKRKPVVVDAPLAAAANALRAGYSLEDRTVDEVVRALFVLHVPTDDLAVYEKTMHQLFTTADMAELAALYAGFPLFAHPTFLSKQGEEGLRTNMSGVFDALVLNNPFPADHFSENAWNNMVLKAFFTERPTYKIQRQEERQNATLARILIDYAHERWAAHRTVAPELWRNVGPFINETYLPDVTRALNSNEPISQQAAILALTQSSYAPAQALATQHPLKEEVDAGTLTWNSIGEAVWNTTA